MLRFGSVNRRLVSYPEICRFASAFIKRHLFYRFVNERNYFPDVSPRVLCPGEDIRGYAAWCEEREKQVSIAYHTYPLRKRPLFSVLVPVYDPQPQWLEECIDSVRSQKYARWELILSDDGSRLAYVPAILEKAGSADDRIRVVRSKDRCGISGATNKAARKACGEFLVFLDHDDILDPYALRAFAVALNENSDSGRVDIFYADEDFMTEGETAFRSPSFKPKFSPDLLLATNYMHHPIVIRKSVFNRLGGLRSCYDGSQDHDLLLRASEVCEKIVHIPDVLYHMRVHSGSLAAGSQAKPEAHDRDRMLIEETLARRGISGEVFQSTWGHRGQNVIKRKLPDSVSITVLIVSEGGVDPGENASLWANHPCGFGDPGLAIPEQINKMARDAQGDILIVVSSAIRPKQGWEQALVPHILRQEIGLVTGKITYDDDTLFSCGLVLGMGGASGSWHHRWPAKQPGLAGWLAVDHEVSAVPWQFMGVRRKLFSEAGGVNTAYRQNGFVEDLALQLTLRLKLRHLAIPSAEVCLAQDYPNDTNAWHEADRRLFRSAWEKYLCQGDPFLNPNYSLSDDTVRIGGKANLTVQGHWWPPVLRTAG